MVPIGIINFLSTDNDVGVDRRVKILKNGVPLEIVSHDFSCYTSRLTIPVSYEPAYRARLQMQDLKLLECA